MNVYIILNIASPQTFQPQPNEGASHIHEDSRSIRKHPAGFCISSAIQVTATLAKTSVVKYTCP